MREILATLIFITAFSFGLSAMAEDLKPSAAAAEAAKADTGNDEHTEAALNRAAGLEGQTQDEVAPSPSEAKQKNDEVIEKGTIQLKGKSEKVDAVTKEVEKAVAPDQAAAANDAKKVEKKEKTEKKTAAKTTAKTTVKNDSGEGVSADTSLHWLQNGNARYVKKNLRADGKSAADRKRLLKEQKPHAIILSCSDSRVPPEIIFDQALGEIYVIRVAGEALDSTVIASIEDAVLHLGPQLLVVMGHSECSTVKAALERKDTSAESSDLDKLLNDIKPRLKTVENETPSEKLEVESAVNADGVARDLVRRSEVIRKAVESGRLTIKTALYRMDSGKVNFY